MCTKGLYLWWVAEIGHPPATAKQADTFELCRRAWELRRQVDELDDLEQIRLIREAWDVAGDDTAMRDRVWEQLVRQRPELKTAMIDVPDGPGPRSGSFQFVWWGLRPSEWGDLGQLGPFPNVPSERVHGRIYSWRLNLGPLEIRRWA